MKNKKVRSPYRGRTFLSKIKLSDESYESFTAQDYIIKRDIKRNHQNSIKVIKRKRIVRLLRINFGNSNLPLKWFLNEKIKSCKKERI